MMSVHQKPFSWTILNWLFTATECVLRCFLYCVTCLLGPFIPTTKELQKPWILMLQKFFLCPLYLLGVVALLSPAYTAFIFRYILHQFRHPYCLSVSLEERPWLLKRKRKMNLGLRTGMPSSDSAELYSFSTMNLCLLPELCSKINNLDKTRQRARIVGERIVVDQFFFTNISERFWNMQNGYVRHNVSYKNFETKQGLEEDVGVVSHFSHLDFICFQETFDRDCAKLLVRELHKAFPWIIYDVGICGIKTNLCGLSSGLMVASRHPIMNVGFKPFFSKTGLDLACDKGLLMVKVYLDDSEKRPQKKVGYVFNAHLQSFQGRKPIVQTQMDNIVEWTAKFRQETSCQGETVVFDVLCGDFNIDNLSPGEVHLGQHKLFSIYRDFCRVQPGKDKDWTVGTEMRMPTLQDEAVSTPAGLKKVLEDPYHRQQYIIDADMETTTMSSIYSAVVKTDKHGNVKLSPVGGKRRIDLILYREDCDVEVTDYHFVTRLASLTDHIPVEMRISCPQT